MPDGEALECSLDTYESPAHDIDPAIAIDWSRSFEHGPPSEEVWNQRLLPALTTVTDCLIQKFLERIGEKYLPYAGFLVFGFIPLVVGVTQVLQFTDIRLWVGSGLLGLGLVIALALLVLADWDRISSLLNR